MVGGGPGIPLAATAPLLSLPSPSPPGPPTPGQGGARSPTRASGDSQTAARLAGALGMLSRPAPGSRVGSLCLVAAAEPAGAHEERAGLACSGGRAAVDPGRDRNQAPRGAPRPPAAAPALLHSRTLAGNGPTAAGVGEAEEPRRPPLHPRRLPRPGSVPEPSGMEPWKQCALWLIHCKVLPANHRVTWDSAQVFDLAQTLRDGVLLCQLLNNLRAHSINLKEINLRPQMSQVRRPARAPPPPAGKSH